jgi:hypothetical protein
MPTTHASRFVIIGIIDSNEWSLKGLLRNGFKSIFNKTYNLTIFLNFNILFECKIFSAKINAFNSTQIIRVEALLQSYQ